MLLEPKVTSGIECSPSLLTNAALTASARNLAITQLKKEQLASNTWKLLPLKINPIPHF